MNSSRPHTPNDPRSAMSRLLNRDPDPTTVAQATKAIALPRSSRREIQLNVLLVRCASEWFALPASCVVRVTRVTAVHALPHRTAHGFRGLTALSGAVVPVVDLVALLRLLPAGEQLTRTPRTVAIGDAASPWAFEADEVPGVFAIAHSAISPLPVTVASAPSRISKGLVLTPHGSASLIDPERLFSELTQLLA